MKYKLKKKSFGEKLFLIINNVFLTIIGFLCAYPFYYLFIYSISDPALASNGVVIIPLSFSLDNYIEIFHQPMIVNAIFISFSRAVLGTALTITFSFLFAYLVTKEQLPFRKLIYRFLIITLYFHPGIIPWYITMKGLGLKNNFLLYIIPGAISAFYVILIKTYIEGISPAFEESAQLDGAGIFTIITKIMVPLAIPIIGTVAVFSLVGQWNSWYDNLLLVTSRNLKTLQLTLYQLFTSYMNEIMRRAQGMSGSNELKITPMSIRMAMATLTIVPIFIAYPLLQRFFVKGITLGAIKG